MNKQKEETMKEIKESVPLGMMRAVLKKLDAEELAKVDAAEAADADAEAKAEPASVDTSEEEE